MIGLNQQYGSYALFSFLTLISDLKSNKNISKWKCEARIRPKQFKAK